MPTPSHALIELPTNRLLDKFGSGQHAPGSGSAAALMGLLAAKLVLTVGSLTLGKQEYAKVHSAIEVIRERLETDIVPLLLQLFERDATVFDDVIKARRARDQAKDDKEKRRHSEEALEKLREATEIPFQIADACLRLIDHAVVVFDAGFKGARGDTGAAVSAAVAGAMSAVFVINLNLKSFRSSEWAKQQRAKCDALQETLVQKQANALERVMTLRTEQLESMGLDFGSED
jgi:formiminotetrahydrofolate cyclodeaminase